MKKDTKKEKTIVTNVNPTSSELNTDFEELLEDYEHARPDRGQIVQGEVLELTEDTVLLDVGAKRDAVVPTRELASLDETLFEELAIGDQLPVFVTDTSGYDDELFVSIEKGLAQQDWERAESLLASEETLELKVKGHNKGGLLLAFGRLDGFVPNSMIPGLPRGLSRNEKQTQKVKLIGSTLQVKVIEVDQNNRRLILSGKAAESVRRKERLQELEVGKKVTGIVSNVVDFGVFVDLGGVDGLIHRSRISWEKVNRPSDIFQSGDEVEVLIKDVDIERERVSLDRRALLPNPWDDFAEKYQHGDSLKGEVVSVRDFGAFVKITDQITGLLHVSEFLPGVSRDPKSTFDLGDEVPVRIVEIDKEQQRVSLSMRRLPEDNIGNWVIDA
jgi:small subunit ribosomal protein S1